MSAIDFTFDRLAVGSGNRVAASAARSFSTAAAPLFNPLCICGGGGLGKSHLIGAIENEFAGRWPAADRAAMTGDELGIGHLATIRLGADLDFQLQLRRAQLLLVDDLQCLAGRAATQAMLAQVIGAVIASGGRVAMACDRAPYELEGFDGRLLGMIESGLVVDLEPPDVEHGLEILRTMATEGRVGEIDPAALHFLARQLGTNIRLMRGAFNRLITYAETDERSIDLDYVHEILGDVLRAHRRRITVDEIQRTVSRHFEIRPAEMTSARRSRDVARPRQVAMYLSKQLTSRSLPEIGRLFGGRDHTTVIHAIRQIEKLRASDSDLDQNVSRLERSLSQ